MTFAFVIRNNDTTKEYPKEKWIIYRANCSNFAIYRIPENHTMKDLRNSCRNIPYNAFSLSVGNGSQLRLKEENFQKMITLLYQERYEIWGHETNARLAYLVFKMVRGIDYVDSRWLRQGDDAYFQLNDCIARLINRILKENGYEVCDFDVGEARVEFKDKQSLSFIKETIKKLKAHQRAVLRLICSTGCKTTDHSKLLCSRENISLIDMESYTKLLALVLIQLLEHGEDFEVFLNSYSTYYSHLEKNYSKCARSGTKRKNSDVDIDHQFIAHDRVIVFQEEKNEPYRFAITDGRSTSKDEFIRINALRVQSSDPGNEDPVIFKFEDSTL